MPVNGRFKLTLADLKSANVLEFEGDDLNLLFLAGPLLKRAGGTADLGGSGSYAVTHQWSAAVHANPAGYDGILYMSRHLNNGKAVVLFDRAAAKITLAHHQPLIKHPRFPDVASTLGIGS